MLKSYGALKGLSAQEVERSRQEHGANILPHKKKKGFFRQFLSNFGDPLIKILLAALCVNVVMLIKTADWYESVGIAVAVFLATLCPHCPNMAARPPLRRCRPKRRKSIAACCGMGRSPAFPSAILWWGTMCC